MNEVYNRRREVQEAIFAGERARASLQEADRQFASAGNWGLIDIFGGNTVSGLMKHMKINNASRCVEEARRDLDAFRSELGDLRDIDGLNVDISGFLTFADFFFDGVIADYLVQTKINDAKIQVRDAIQSVSGILAQLKTKAV